MEDTTIEDVLKTFESFYLKKDYPNALLVLANHKKDMESGTWHYNMGTVLAQTQRLSEARYHLMMASKAGFQSKGLIQNKDMVEEKLEIGRLEQPLSAGDYFVKASLFLSDGILTSLSLLVLMMGLWILRKKADFRKITLFLVLVLTPIGLNFWIGSWPKAIVAVPVDINEGPSVIFGNRGQVPAGVMVVFKNEGDWKKIIFPSRFQGWIKNNELLELE